MCVSAGCCVNTCILLLKDRPEPPMELDLSDPAARSVRLTWIPGSDHGSPITRLYFFTTKNYNDMLYLYCNTSARASIIKILFLCYIIKLNFIDNVLETVVEVTENFS